MKKNIAIASVLVLSAALFVSCGKDGTTPTPSPTPSKTASVRVDFEATPDLLEIIDFSGSKLEIDGQTTDLSGADFDKTFSITKTTTGSLKIVAKMKKDFKFATGRTYDVVGLVEFSFNGAPAMSRPLALTGFSYDEELKKQKPRSMEKIIDRWCRKISADYKFTVNPDGTISDSGR